MSAPPVTKILFSSPSNCFKINVPSFFLLSTATEMLQRPGDSGRIRLSPSFGLLVLPELTALALICAGTLPGATFPTSDLLVSSRSVVGWFSGHRLSLWGIGWASLIPTPISLVLTARNPASSNASILQFIKRPQDRVGAGQN